MKALLSSHSLLVFRPWQVAARAQSLYDAHSMLSNLLSSTAYVQVRRNQFRVRSLESGMDVTVVSQTPFTTARLLVGQFVVAERELKDALRQIAKGRLLPISPRMLIHPMEMVDGGLSAIEERIFREVALGAGASKVVVWTGCELNDAEVKQKLSGT